MAGLKIKNLSKSFNGKRVVDRLSLDVPEGEFCIFLGPSGCGKSTVLRLIAGIEAQDEGTIHIGEVDVSALSPKERDVAMVFQSYALYPHLTVYENMAFPLRIKKTPRADIERKVREAAAMLNITELLDRKPREISGGEKQRVAIGRAIVRNPNLFLFDEPLSNLDARLRGGMRLELARLHRKLRATTIYVTHDQVEAMTLGQKIVLLNDGRVQQIGTPQDLYERPVNVFTASFIGAPPMNLLAGEILAEADGVRFRTPAFTVPLKGRPDLRTYDGRMVVAGIRAESLHPGGGIIEGRLEYSEHMGSEVILYVKAGGERIVARAPADFEADMEAPVRLDFSPDSMHFFFEGTRIERPVPAIRSQSVRTDPE